MQAHVFQRNAVSVAERPILNAACKEDPAKLSQYGVVNLDLLDFDPHTRTKLTSLRNFVHGSVTDLTTLFEPEHFKTIVLGVFLEHCSIPYGHEVLEEIYKALPVGGVLILTFPLDNRPAATQHGKQHLKILVGDEENPKFTTWHRTLWEGPELEELLHESRWKILTKETLHYGFTKKGGYGIVAEKLSAE